ncbi:MAG: glycoside hydrolase family 125 protein [Verrucomicrobiota bacterium]
MNKYIPTGNEYLAIPAIRQDDGSIESINVVLMKLDGLLEICGAGDEPLVSVPGMQRESGKWNWRFREEWIPQFNHAQDPSLSGVICAPPGECFALFRAPTLGDPTEFRVSVGDIYQTANIRHKLPRCDFAIRRFGWANEVGVMIDLFAGTLLASVSLRCPGAARYFFEGSRGAEEIGTSPLSVSGPFRLKIECRGEPVLVLGVNLTSVGAMSAGLEVGRVAPDEWVRRTEDWLKARRVSVPRDTALEVKANRNGHFARFYAMARTLDTGEVVSMTSRSHRYYVSSAYWDRDALLWLYPFLVRNDKALAEDLLRYAYGRQLAGAGIHSRYISGRVLEFGFELDELLAPLVAAGTWNWLHPADEIWLAPSIRAGILSLLERLRRYRDEATGLYRTELMPTDDRVEGGRDILTYNNALAVYALQVCLPMLEKISRSTAAFARAEIPGLRSAIRRHLVRDNRFVWAADRAGNTEFYDEAAGSLTLLPYYGFCAVNDPVYRNTVDYLYSPQYPHYRPGPFAELGNRHTGTAHPWVLSACNSVLGGARVQEGLDFLRRAPMDNGIACESVDVNTGETGTGEHFATCAGFVAHAIMTGAR